jgi:CHASE3 domain sensor protein
MLDQEKLARLIAGIKVSAGGSAGREAARAELDADLGIELASQLETLSKEMSQLREAVTAAAAGSSRQANALVRWTKWYVIATAVLVLNAVILPWWPLIQQWWRWGAFK